MGGQTPAYDPNGSHQQVFSRAVDATGAPVPSGLVADPVFTKPPFSTPGKVAVDFTPVGSAGSYAAYAALGPTGAGLAVFTIPIGAAGTKARITGLNLQVPMTGITTVGGNFLADIFESAPAAATYTDGSVVTWVAAEIAKIRRGILLIAQLVVAAGTKAAYAATNNGSSVSVDVTATDGNIYIVLSALTTTAWNTPGLSRLTVDFQT